MTDDSCRKTIQRFVLVSPCGWGNLGDAAIQDSVIHQLNLAGIGKSEIFAVTQVPSDTIRRHGVAAGHLDAQRNNSLLDRLVSALRPHGRVANIASIPLALVSRLSREAHHWVYAWRALESCTCLVISGGGQLDDLWGGSFGHPYALFKWTVLAKARRARIIALSVGAGRIQGIVSRYFIRQVLVRCDYLSVRDECTKQIALDIAPSSRVNVVPDLAFGYAPSCRSVPIGRRCVAVSPMAIKKPGAWPESNQGQYEHYLSCLSKAVSRLASLGYLVKLVVTDTKDRLAAAALLEMIVREQGDEISSFVHLEAASEVQDVMDLLSASEIVVASRLHGVILSHLVGRPVVAISYDWKVSRHMKDMGQAAYVVELEGLEAPDLLNVIDGALLQRRELGDSIVRQRDVFCARVLQQFRDVLASEVEVRCLA